ncbi:hypothetical protein [Reichenbachiella sp. MALMAid0571]|uniref:hypothetical protein n=1 Tax=Reichenbachiella sp. MALMAid0571 TaxID=3143939 RepID=UPI0032DF7D77
MIKKSLLAVSAVLFFSMKSFAQCAMCKTTVVNNVNNGELNLAEGLNFGIMYLFFTPYLVIAVVAFFWYRNSKSNARNKQYKSLS